MTRHNTGWSWLVVVLAGILPFASDMFRNFQLFTPAQLIWTFAAVLAGTSGVFFATWCGVRLVEYIILRRGKRSIPWLANGLFALAAAIVLAVFLYDSNMTELRQVYKLPRIGAVVIVMALFAIYWAAGVRLGPKRTCVLLGALLAIRSGQATWQIYNSRAYGDFFTEIGKIQNYQKVKLDRTPNIYLIILESYHGFGAMKELYGFDNRSFHALLDEMNFVVADETFANYTNTMASLHSFFLMGHHYAAGMFGNDDSLYVRGFLSGSGIYYNPVLNILKQNGYSIVFLLPSDYYYRPGAGLVDMSLLSGGWRLAPLKISFPRFLGDEPNTLVPDYDLQVSQAITRWPSDKPAFFFIKMGAEHSSSTHAYHYQTDRDEFVRKYVNAVKQSNLTLESLCHQIIEKDPEAIVVLAGDHGARSYKDSRKEFPDLVRENGLAAELAAKDMHDVLLAIRWGQDIEPERYPFRSLVNVMRFVFYRLCSDKALIDSAAKDDSFVLHFGRRILYQSVEDGRPLKEWRVAR